MNYRDGLKVGAYINNAPASCGGPSPHYMADRVGRVKITSLTRPYDGVGFRERREYRRAGP